MSLQVTPTPLLEHIHEIFSTGQYPPCPPNVEKGTRIALHTAERTPVASATAKGGGSRRFRRDIIKLFMRQNAGSAPPMHVFNDSRNCTFNEASGDGRFWPLATEDHALAQEYSTQRAPKKSDAPPQPVLYIPIPVLERISQNPLGSGQLTIPVTQNLDPRGSIEEVHVFVQCPDEESLWPSTRERIASSWTENRSSLESTGERLGNTRRTGLAYNWDRFQPAPARGVRRPS
ncbi:hypothetical protein OF83DRAFT_23729 [Amylostereum chailletii]|nr:hypothetical protein OF83DRAFT_23729 [Amylostereum chailletii]